MRCVGANGKHKTPGIDYDYSVQNIVIGVVFSEMFLIPPAIVLLTELECPITDTTTVPPNAP